MRSVRSPPPIGRDRGALAPLLQHKRRRENERAYEIDIWGRHPRMRVTTLENDFRFIRMLLDKTTSIYTYRFNQKYLYVLSEPWLAGSLNHQIQNNFEHTLFCSMNFVPLSNTYSSIFKPSECKNSICSVRTGTGLMTYPHFLMSWYKDEIVQECPGRGRQSLKTVSPQQCCNIMQHLCFLIQSTVCPPASVSFAHLHLSSCSLSPLHLGPQPCALSKKWILEGVAYIYICVCV